MSAMTSSSLAVKELLSTISNRSRLPFPPNVESRAGNGTRQADSELDERGSSRTDECRTTTTTKLQADAIHDLPFGRRASRPLLPCRRV
ncbi:hypothetical protein PG991_008236 [Apiospora marii]|uniref:Uncharacterized protein n=1 Tax=Apiospora marii TaxID=335849 RepID=A0ABR1RQB6_9PEZI